MIRPRWWHGLTIGFLGAALSLGFGGGHATAAGPNVVVIVTDDQRALGTMQVMPQTRRLFYRGGTRFTNAWATTPLCCPARASILTGQYAHNHDVLLNTHGRRLDEDTAIQRHLARAGYHTAIIGKYLNHRPLEIPPAHFDEYMVSAGGYYDTVWNLNGSVRTVRRYSTDFITARARGFVRRAASAKRRPWFLYLAPSAAHAPVTPAPAYARARVGRFPSNPALEETDLSDKPRFVRDLSERRFPPELRPRYVRRNQLRTLMSVDDLVGALRRVLVRTKQLRSTLLIFTSDSGLMWGEHGMPTIKDVPYREATRVPLLVRWPERVAPSRRDRRFTALIDIAPTILDAARLALPSDPPMDGRSLLDRRWTRDRILLEYFGHELIPAWSGLVTRRVQYTRYAPHQGDPGFAEYYRRDSDPFQLNNLLRSAGATDHPPAEELIALNQRLVQDLDCKGTSCP